MDGPILSEKRPLSQSTDSSALDKAHLGILYGQPLWHSIFWHSMAKCIYGMQCLYGNTALYGNASMA